MPLVLWTTLLRLLNLANSTGPGGNNEGVERGILVIDAALSSRCALCDLLTRYNYEARRNEIRDR